MKSLPEIRTEFTNTSYWFGHDKNWPSISGQSESHEVDDRLEVLIVLDIAQW